MMFTLQLLPDKLAVCQIPGKDMPTLKLPEGVFCSITHTLDEISVVLPESSVQANWKTETGWKAFKVVGPLAFDMIGVVASLSKILAEAEISIFVLSTYDTDYILLKSNLLNRAKKALETAGHRIIS